MARLLARDQRADGLPAGPGDPAAIELLRAVVEFFTRGLPNAKRYEGRVEEEFAAGPDGTPDGRRRPAPFARPTGPTPSSAAARLLLMGSACP